MMRDTLLYAAGDVRVEDVTGAHADPQDADAVDAAYHEKYARYPSYVEPMVSDQARATTLRLVPGDGEVQA